MDLLGGKGITKITIKNCPNIYSINITSNLISEIVGLTELKDLQRLWISNNKITDSDIMIKNENLIFFSCPKNPIEGGEINGRLLNKLVFFSGGGISEEKKIFYSVEKDYRKKMEELAKKLGIKDKELKDKPVSEIEKLVSDKASEVKKGDELSKEGLNKVGENFPGLVSEGKVDEDKLKELKTKLNGAETNVALVATQKQKINDLIETVEKQNKAIEKYGKGLNNYTGRDESWKNEIVDVSKLKS